MLKAFRLWPYSFVLAVCSSLATSAYGADSGRNVIFLTWDGVRTEDFFNGPDPELSQGDDEKLLPYFWSEMAPRGIVLGNRWERNIATIGNPTGVSLPAYQSIMAGSMQPCFNNDCKAIQTETFPERLVRELGFAKKDVATIASWARIADAVEAQKGATFVNAGMQALDDGSDDPELQALNEDQANNQPPWAPARYDRHTWAQAMRYLRVHKPRFLYVSLDDSDEYGHRNDYPSYMGALRQYDRWLEELSGTLRELGEYGEKTCLIMTTDHGRGKGTGWAHHGGLRAGSQYVWIYGSCGLTSAPSPMRWRFPTVHTHLDIRPTVEALFGLAPKSCVFCGKPIKELVH